MMHIFGNNSESMHVTQTWYTPSTD